MFGRIDSERTKTGRKTETKTHYLVMSQRLPVWRMLATARRHWSVENHLHRQLDVVFREGRIPDPKGQCPRQSLRDPAHGARHALAHLDWRSTSHCKMNLARWSKSVFHELFSYVR